MTSRLDEDSGWAPGTPDRDRPTPRVDVLGVGISCVNLGTALDEIEHWVKEGSEHYICITGVHGVMEAQVSQKLRDIHNASGMTTPDGMPLVWAAHWAGAKEVSRVYGPDLMLAVCERAVGLGWRMYFMGGAPAVPATLARRLRDRFPGLNVVGTSSPPFRPMTDEEDQKLVDEINKAAPDIVWVGLSTPKQELWMDAHRSRLTAPILVGVGAAFDIHAGTLKQAPPWMQRRGLEWLYRLLREPRRLWRRYLSIVPRFMIAIIRHPPRLGQS
jgi:N-acetylglucosaminyldiphosphoundecaprenol N-acetyl-beta-D-mannosaminyltransferase